MQAQTRTHTRARAHVGPHLPRPAPFACRLPWKPLLEQTIKQKGFMVVAFRHQGRHARLKVAASDSGPEVMAPVVRREGGYASSSEDDDEDARLAESARASARLGRRGPGLRTALRSSRPARGVRSPPRPKWGALGLVRRTGDESSAPFRAGDQDTVMTSPYASSPARHLPISARVARKSVEEGTGAALGSAPERTPTPLDVDNSASLSHAFGGDVESVQGEELSSQGSTGTRVREGRRRRMSSTPGTRADLTGLARDYTPRGEADAEAAALGAKAATACDVWVAEAEEGLVRVQEERLSQAVAAMRERDAEVRDRLRGQAWSAREAYLREVEDLRQAFARGAEAAFAKMEKTVDQAIASAMHTPPPKRGARESAPRQPAVVALTTPPPSPRTKRISSAPASPGLGAERGARKGSMPRKPFPSSAARSPRRRGASVPTGSSSAAATPGTGEKKLRRAARELLESDDDSDRDD